LAPSSHPLIDARVATALALAGLCGAGWGLIAAQFIAVGFFLAFIGTAATAGAQPATES
jgi:hypothetical protein